MASTSVRLIKIVFCFALLTLSLVACNQPPRAAPEHRPYLKRFNVLARTYKNDRAAFINALAREEVTLKVKWFCYIASNDQVACTDIEALITEQLLHAADKHLVMMALNDLLEMLGGTQGMDTLLGCGRANLTGLTHVIPANGASVLDNLTNDTASVSLNDSAILHLNNAPEDLLLETCRHIQRGAIRDGLRQPVAGDRGYTEATESAISAMDAAMSECRDVNKGLTNPGSDNGTTGAVNDENSSEEILDDGNDSDASEETLPDEQPNTSEPNLLEGVTTVMNVTMGVAGILAAGPPGSPGSFLAMTLAMVDTGGTMGGVLGNETADTVGNVASVASLLWSMGSAEAGAIVVSGMATDGALVEGLAVALDVGLATEASAAFFPIVGAFFGGYAAMRLTNDITGGAIDRGAVDAFGILSDNYYEWQYNTSDTNENRQGNNPQQSGPDQQSSNCTKLQNWWNSFKSYCSQPGNDWKNYACVYFVARMNGCADPALINPGPNGDYVCHANCRDFGNPRRNVCEQEERISSCERRNDIAEQFGSSPGPGGTHSESCRDRITNLYGFEQQFQELTRQHLCSRIQPDPNGDPNFCAPPPSP